MDRALGYILFVDGYNAIKRSPAWSHLTLHAARQRLLDTFERRRWPMASTSAPRVSAIAAVCFDLDGVLIDTMPLHAQAWQEALKPLGLRVSRRQIYEWEGEPGLVTARTLLSDRGRATPPVRAAALLRAKERRFRALADGITVPSRLIRLVQRLSRCGLGLAHVTVSSIKGLERQLERRVFDKASWGSVQYRQRMRRRAC